MRERQRHKLQEGHGGHIQAGAFVSPEWKAGKVRCVLFALTGVCYCYFALSKILDK